MMMMMMMMTLMVMAIMSLECLQLTYTKQLNIALYVLAITFDQDRYFNTDLKQGMVDLEMGVYER